MAIAPVDWQRNDRQGWRLNSGPPSYTYAFYKDGGRYNLASNTWAPVGTSNAPSAREYHTAVWTGAEMIIWGGRFLSGNWQCLNDGARYNPTTDTWVPLA